MSQTEVLGTDLTQWEIGPFHAALPGPMKLALKIDGEIIVDCKVETGFLHKGLEKIFEKHSWHHLTAYADRLSPDAAIFSELALCLAVEQLIQVSVPDRAQGIRIVLSELNRISSHLNYLGRVSRTIAGETLFHYVSRDREKVLDLFELLTGARHTYNFLRYGGVAGDVTEGFVERVIELCDLLRFRLKEYNDLFTFNQAFMKRSIGVGCVSKDVTLRYGICGPNLRAVGVGKDLRKQAPYSGYEKIDFPMVYGKGNSTNMGDVHDRFLLRLREIGTSAEILRQVVDSLPKGAHHAGLDWRSTVVPKGEAYVRVESARGALGCYVVSDGSKNPVRVQFSVPSLPTLSLIPHIIKGERIDDLPMILQSLDLSLPEIDR